MGDSLAEIGGELMKTLEEYIAYCEEVAEEKEREAWSFPKADSKIKGSGSKHSRCMRYASEHRQLAEWLKELKAIKEVIDNQGDTNNAWIFLEKIEDILYPINEITYDNKGEVKADDKKEV